MRSAATPNAWSPTGSLGGGNAACCPGGGAPWQGQQVYAEAMAGGVAADDGDDCADALEKLSALVTDRFGED